MFLLLTKKCLLLLIISLLVGVSALNFDSVVPMNETIPHGYDLKLMYRNRENVSAQPISPITYKYDKTIDLLRTTAEYYEKEVPKVSENVDNFLNTKLTDVSEKCLNLNDTIGWLNFQMNYTAFQQEAKNLQAFLVSPPKEPDNTFEAVIRSTNFIIRMGHFIKSFQFCLENEKQLTEDDVMGVMHIILRQVIKNVFLAGKVNLDADYRESSQSSKCLQVFYPMRSSNYLFDALMDNFNSPFESCYSQKDFEKCAHHLLKNCEPELAAILRMSWCPANYGCYN
ncbi:uncharacterized protein LOC127286825 isoform X2 [Leptopilina boulardi]|uniref:uncharacterized protein LOC127286825 isoform X2 n=1 Tax=Leptopilina boulardi TaxID=63433 RepID=UPI0021F5E87C|nr:uncharacterized protein LOC127286825 isoform X2 [Leptopilina boulardi]